MFNYNSFMNKFKIWRSKPIFWVIMFFVWPLFLLWLLGLWSINDIKINHDLRPWYKIRGTYGLVIIGLIFILAHTPKNESNVTEVDSQSSSELVSDQSDKNDDQSSSETISISETEASSEAKEDSSSSSESSLVSSSIESSSPSSVQPSSTGVPREYKSALNSADTYANRMHMSKAGLYEQLTADAGEKFSPEAAQYAIDNVQTDWNKNALESAKSYQKMDMSPESIRDQLTADAGEKFTQEQADYAVANLPK